MSGASARLSRDPRTPRLSSEQAGARTILYTEALSAVPSIYGERVLWRNRQAFRWFDPFRSKLAAAATVAPRLPLPLPGERWLYLGAGSGTTASHVADLLGPKGSLFAVEKSPRPFRRLLEIAEQYPNLLPIFADAQNPEGYSTLVPPVDGVYLDIAQPDQVEIARRNSREFLRPGGRLLLALKASSIGREHTPEEHARSVVPALREFGIGAPVSLAPFYRAHWMLSGGLGAPPTGPSAASRRSRGARRVSPRERGRFNRRGRHRAGRAP